MPANTKAGLDPSKGRRHPLRAVNRLAVGGLGTELLTVRVALDPIREPSPLKVGGLTKRRRRAIPRHRR